MNNPERAHYPALTRADLRALYAAEPTPVVRRLVWEIYCLQVVVKTAGAVIRCRNLGGAVMPGGLDFVLDELARVLQTEIYIHENFRSLMDIHEKRRLRTSTKKRNKKAFRSD
ncbi:hypothetical protein Q3O97_05965 [Ralstonia pseudosolanacearum]|uniref:hypothetical protein n=1 Tax=Ralstonia pseudosolanacearum TaxID=1310165 RepID=UPI002701CCCC|nr:hypothetical protein [Ralstonia pseudosolanacearum]MDO3615385.1 hypothetical protein [Ralstonia pseudosolanacearum]